MPRNNSAAARRRRQEAARLRLQAADAAQIGSGHNSSSNAISTRAVQPQECHPGPFGCEAHRITEPFTYATHFVQGLLVDGQGHPAGGGVLAWCLGLEDARRCLSLLQRCRYIQTSSLEVGLREDLELV